MFRAFVVVLVLGATGCESAYYSFNEEILGRHKRDLLRNSVEDAMSAQEEAKEEFASALEQFEAVVGLPDSDLKNIYEKLNDAYEDAESKAERVSSRVDEVEDVADDLFDEWERERDEISNANLRRKSGQQLKASRSRSQALLTAMRKAEARMQPVLTSFKDHVLYLKHNLNSQAVAALESELDGIENDVGRLIREMEASIAEAQGFLKDWEGA